MVDKVSVEALDTLPSNIANSIVSFFFFTIPQGAMISFFDRVSNSSLIFSISSFVISFDSLTNLFRIGLQNRTENETFGVLFCHLYSRLNANERGNFEKY